MAESIITDIRPTSLAEYESLIGDKDVARKTFLHTIRDYMPFFDQAVIIPGNDGMGDKGQLVTSYPEGELHGYNEGWRSENVVGQNMRYTCQRRSSSSSIDKDQYDDQPERIVRLGVCVATRPSLVALPVQRSATSSTAIRPRIRTPARACSKSSSRATKSLAIAALTPAAPPTAR